MTSKGGKIEYRCPECGSKWISKNITRVGHQGVCEDCNTFWPWHTRIKLTRAQVKACEAKEIVEMLKNQPFITASIGLRHD
jgi:DNA-directed RNA polymerase subunit RPC12/RpoP